MDYILNIHTASEKAIVAICDEKKVVATMTNEDSKSHGTFLHEAIHKVLHNNDISMTDLKAIGVSNGPGSYTGIRVGLATAKGLCYALGIPLVTYSTLEVMTRSAIQEKKDKNAFYCPMIDARRMEVFTALYDADLNLVEQPSARILEENSYREFLDLRPVYFYGNGSSKLQHLLIEQPRAHFISNEITAEDLCSISWERVKNSQFDSVAYAEPSYLKEFFFMQKQG